MTNQVVALFQQSQALALPEYMKASSDASTAALGGGFGDGRNRIGFKGARFRLIQAGAEVAVRDENHLDVIIVAANPDVARTFYAGKYDPAIKAPPVCFSANGVSPDPASVARQSATCAACAQNQKGSRITEDGKKSRACQFSKRLVVMLNGDNDKMLYQVDLKSMSIFGDGVVSKGLYTLSEYAKALALKNVHMSGVVTRMSFDTDSSVPKVYFTPVGFVPEAEFKAVRALEQTEACRHMLEVTAATVDLSGETDMAPAAAAVAPVAAAVAPVAAAVAPVAVAPVAPVAAVAPVAPVAAAPLAIPIGVAPAPVAVAAVAAVAPAAVVAPVLAGDDALGAALAGLM